MKCRYPTCRSSQPQRSRSRTGMTLVEVVVALAIASLTTVTLVGGYVYTTLSAETASLSLAANASAMERLEDTHGARWEPWSWPLVDELWATNFPTKGAVLDLSGQGAGVTYATNYTTISQIATNPPLRRIRVDCVWQFRNRQFSRWFTNTVEACRGPD